MQRVSPILRSYWVRYILLGLLLTVVVLSACTVALLVVVGLNFGEGEWEWHGEEEWVQGQWAKNEESHLPRMTSPQWTPGGSRIVFTKLKHRRSSPQWLEDDIYVVESDGSRLRRIAKGAYWPSISPNRSRIAYGYVRSVEFTGIGLRTSRLNGSDRRTLVQMHPGESDGPPSWSPDGKRIAFSRLSKGVYTIDAELTYHPRVFPFGSLEESDPHGHEPRWGPIWSPDGQTLAFVVAEVWFTPDDSGSVFTSRDVLYTVGADGSEPTRLFATTPDYVSYGIPRKDRIVGPPLWSPDGRRLTFIRATTHPDYVALATDEEREFDPVSVVHVIEANGSGLRAVAEFGTHTLESSLSWSPSGTEILFTLGDGHIYVADADSGSYRQIGKGSRASWSPDGSRIAIFDDSSSDYIFTIAPDGSDVRVLVRKDPGGDLKVVNR